MLVNLDTGLVLLMLFRRSRGSSRRSSARSRRCSRGRSAGCLAAQARSHRRRGLVCSERGKGRDGAGDGVWFVSCGAVVLWCEACVHWVGEVKGAVERVSQGLQKSDVERGQHGMIFVDEIVAVEHVDAIPWSVVSQDLRSLTGLEEDGILQTCRFVREESSRAASTGNDLEVDKMDMDGVDCEAASVVEGPKLG